MQATISRGAPMPGLSEWVRSNATAITSGVGGVILALAGHWVKGLWSFRTKRLESDVQTKKIQAAEQHTKAEDGLAERRLAREEWMALVNDLRAQIKDNRQHAEAQDRRIEALSDRLDETEARVRALELEKNALTLQRDALQAEVERLTLLSANQRDSLLQYDSRVSELEARIAKKALLIAEMESELERLRGEAK